MAEKINHQINSEGNIGDYDPYNELTQSDRSLDLSTTKQYLNAKDIAAQIYTKDDGYSKKESSSPTKDSKNLEKKDENQAVDKQQTNKKEAAAKESAAKDQRVSDERRHDQQVKQRKESAAKETDQSDEKTVNQDQKESVIDAVLGFFGMSKLSKKVNCIS